jgi:short-subunit dehydrogenase
MTSKHVFITGSTSGIGQSLVNKYIDKGFKVTACGRNKKKLSQLKNVHNTCLFDINNSDEMSQATQNVDDIDILILNAGDCRYIDNAKQFNGKLFADIISTNLTSLGYLLQFLLPKMKKEGQVVFISSSATILPFPRSEAYGASKAGMDYLANSLRLDLSQHNIDVTLVHPGFVKTPLTNKNTFDMPFLITSDEAANRIIKGVNHKKAYLHFPKRFTFILKALSFLPSPLWQWLITRKQHA